MWSSSGYNYDGGHHLHDLNDIPNSLPPSTSATDNHFNLNSGVVRTTSSRLRPLIPKPSPIVSSSTTPPAVNNITSTFHHHHSHSGSSSQDQHYNNNNNYYYNNNNPKETQHYCSSTSTSPMMTVATTSAAQQQQVTTTSRWNPTPEQLQTLEELYRRGTRTPSTEQIQHITSQLTKYGKIEGKNVFYWFQNHKARERQKRRRRDLHHQLEHDNNAAAANINIINNNNNNIDPQKNNYQYLSSSTRDDEDHQHQPRPPLDKGPSFTTSRHQTSGGEAGITERSRFELEGEEKMGTTSSCCCCCCWLQPSTTHCSATIAADSRQQHMTHELPVVMSTQSAAATDAGLAAVISSSTEGRRRRTNSSSSMKDYYYFYKPPIVQAEEGHHDDGGENVIRFDDDDEFRAAVTPNCTTGSMLSRGWNDTWHGQNSSTFCFSSTTAPLPTATATATMIGGSLDQYGMDMMNSTFKASTRNSDEDDHQDCSATLELFPLKAQHLKDPEHDQEGGLLDGGSSYDDRDLRRQIQFYEFL